ncbi:MAG: K(+)-transporting ATPase subunit C [Bacteroidetes bacterium]|nr:K(+)-transporting ATPase subunit C [Bacteroidota bacterium]
MKQHLLPAIRLTIVCIIVFIVIYPAVVWGIAQLTPNKGQAATITVNGKKYYTNIAQRFTADKYFWSRPSAAAYNAASAGGSNKGPTNPGYLKEVQLRIDTFLVHNPGISKNEIPSDVITASGSGLDPDISVPAAMVQVKRIAKTRNLSEATVQQLVQQYIQQPLLGMMGTQRINVLQLNLALDNIK